MDVSKQDLETIIDRIKRISDLYSKRFGVERDGTWYVLKLQEEMGELIQSYLMMAGKARDKGVPEEEIRKNFEYEVADVLCHILLLADYYQVDLPKAVQDKWLKWGDKK